MSAEHVRVASLAADGRVDAALPTTSSDFLQTVRRIVALRSASDGHLETPPHEAVPSAIVTLNVWAGSVRIVLAAAAYVIAHPSIPQANVSTEALALMLTVLGVTGWALVYGGQREARSIALGSLFVLMGSAFSPRLMAGLSDAPLFGRAIMALAHLPTEAFFPVAVWMFARAFPAAPVGWPIQRFTLTMMWLAALAGAGLMTAHIVLAFAPGQSWAQLLYHQRPGRNLFWLVLIAISAPALPAIVWKARSVSIQEQQRVRRFAAALTLGMLPSVVLLAILVFVPSTRPHIERNINAYGWLFYGGLLTIPLTTTYAISSTGVFRVRFMMRRALLASLARGMLIALIVAPLLWLAAEASRSANLTMSDFVASRGVATALALAAAGALLLTIRPHLLAFIERTFEQRRIPTSSALAQAAGRIRAAAGRREIAEAVRICLQDTFGTPNVAVLTAAIGAPRLTPTAGDHQEILRQSAIVELLQSVPEPVVVSGRYASACVRLLPAAERQVLHGAGAEVICGIPNTSGRLLGLVVLGERASELPYGRVDLEHIATLCSTAGIALESHLQPAADTVTAAVECVRCDAVLDATAATCRCGGAVRDARAPFIVSGRYRLERRLGEGGMGVVYAARDVNLDRQVAIKALPQVNRQEASRLTEEARVMASLNHPNIAHVYGLEMWRDTPLLVVELMTRGTLAQRRRQTPALTDPEITEIDRALSAALAYLHQRGLIHRDVKPSNIGFREDGSPALLDFGIAAAIDSADSRQLAGTIAYLPATVLAGTPQDDESDRWALRKVIEELQAQRRSNGRQGDGRRGAESED